MDDETHYHYKQAQDGIGVYRLDDHWEVKDRHLDVAAYHEHGESFENEHDVWRGTGKNARLVRDPNHKPGTKHVSKKQIRHDVEKAHHDEQQRMVQELLRE